MKVEDAYIWQIVSTIIAAIIGAFATIVAVRMTIKNQEKQRIDDNKKKVLPMIKIDSLSNSVKSSNYNELSVKQKTDIPKEDRELNYANRLLIIPIRNVGCREMYNIRVSFCENDIFEGTDFQDVAPIIYKDDLSNIVVNIITYLPKLINEGSSVDISIEEAFSHVQPSTKLSFNVKFDDCFGNTYQQKFAVDITYAYLKVLNGKYAGMHMDFMNTRWIGNYEVLSAPVEISINEVTPKKIEILYNIFNGKKKNR